MNSAAPNTDQGVSPQPGVFLPYLPFQADGRRQQQRQAQLSRLPPPLAVQRTRGRDRSGCLSVIT
jgi:hypothetical protein